MFGFSILGHYSTNLHIIKNAVQRTFLHICGLNWLVLAWSNSLQMLLKIGYHSAFSLFTQSIKFHRVLSNGIH